MTLLLLLKLLTYATTAVLLWQLFELWRAGRLLAAHGALSSVSRHKSKVVWVASLTVAAVLLIEAQVRMSPHRYQSGALLLGFHLVSIALLVVAFFAIILRFTGRKNPYWHRRLVYVFFVLFFLAAGTGAYMLYRLPA